MPPTLKEIAVFFDGSDTGQRVLELAARLASAQNARLVGISTAENTGVATPTDAVVRGVATLEVNQEHQSSIAAHLHHAVHSLARAAARHDVDWTFRGIRYPESVSETTRHFLHSDLLVVAHPAVPGAPFAWSTERVLQQTGGPMLIVPGAWNGEDIGRHIAVAWNGSYPARRAVVDALPLLSAAQVVDVLIIDPERPTQPHGEDPDADLAAYLAGHGVKAEVLRVTSYSRPVAEVIITQALERGADLVVFGAYSRPRISEVVLGGVTRTLLSNVPLPLFVSH